MGQNSEDSTNQDRFFLKASFHKGSNYNDSRGFHGCRGRKRLISFFLGGGTIV